MKASSRRGGAGVLLPGWPSRFLPCRGQPPRQFTMPNPESFSLGIIAGLILFAAIRAAIEAYTDDWPDD